MDISEASQYEREWKELRRMKHTSLILMTVFVAACTTSPVKVSESQQVSSDRLRSGYPALAHALPDKAKVVVIRDAGLLGAAGLFGSRWAERPLLGYGQVTASSSILLGATTSSALARIRS